MNTTKCLATCIFSFIQIAGFSQNLTLDLSKGDDKEPINPRTITSITLVNTLATNNTIYNFDISIQYVPIAVLAIPSDAPPGGAAGLAGSVCLSIDNATTKLINESSESMIPKDVSELRDLIKNAPKGCATSVTAATNTIGFTTLSKTLVTPIIIGRGDILTIKITRGTNTWTFTFTCERINHWTTYYGFTYIPDVLTKFPNYYANQQGDSFAISKMNGKNKSIFQNVSPTAMFTYRFFSKKPDAILKFGITGGIFYNTDILGAMFGPSLVIGDNITLNTGISFIQKYKLKGQYREGQIIQNTLDFDQLHDKIWTYDMFISIGFNIPELFTKKSNTAVTTKPGNTAGN